jgi:hypothetical protein
VRQLKDETHSPARIRRDDLVQLFSIKQETLPMTSVELDRLQVRTLESVPNPELGIPALLETPVRLTTSLLFDSAMSRESTMRSLGGQLRKSVVNPCLEHRKHQNLRFVVSSPGRARTYRYNVNVPPHSRTSPDLTSFTASSADAHNFLRLDDDGMPYHLTAQVTTLRRLLA